ncbi:HAD hydrolase-like protein [Bacillus spongiae]|uniref:HAD hydrolase-like protein n=1 Tax=Bacillus spongiae TaxID=2683610 RepID=A0ABU8HC83_9BACI
MEKAMIFDMDGTLFQTHKILEISLEDTFNHLRSIDLWDSETPINKYKSIMGVPLPVVWETLLPNHDKSIHKYTDEYFLERLIENIERGKGALYPNVAELFSYLKNEDYAIFIASNGLTKYLQAIVRHYGLDQWVTETFSIQLIDSLDKADLVKLIVEKYDIKQAAVVGDRLSDILAAKRNGFKAVGCQFDFAQADELAQADLIIEDLLEIQSILGSDNKSQLLPL